MVYQATHLGNGKAVALKVFPGSLAPTAADVARFERAVKVAATVEHENVCAILDSGIECGLPFIVLEYLKGEALSELVARETLAVVVAADAMLGVCAGLLVAHQQCDLVHGDLSPSCIFLTRTSRVSFLPKLLDFGITRAFGYAAPEQVGGRLPDASSTQHVLAQIMCECLTGKRPSKAWGEPVRAERPDVPPELEAALMRAMSLEPAQRFPSLQAFGEALLPFASVEARTHYQGHFVRVPTAILPPDHPLYPAGGTKVLAPHTYNPAAGEQTGGSSTPAVSPAARPHREPLPRWFVPAALVAGLAVIAAGAAIWFVGGTSQPVLVRVEAPEEPARVSALPEPSPQAQATPEPPAAPPSSPPVATNTAAEPAEERSRPPAPKSRRRGANPRRSEAGGAGAPPPAAAEPLIAEAESALKKGQVTNAAIAAHKAIEAGGGARAHFVLGKIYFNVERWDEALMEFEATLKLDPTNRAALRGRAETQAKRSQESRR